MRNPYCGSATGYLYGCTCLSCARAHADYHADYRHRRQGSTSTAARRYAAPWTPQEDALLQARDGLSVASLALVLGRTYYAVRARITRLNRQEVTA